ncbi:hypothetical protein [Nocardia abscessus]|uniref:hypothetical protein n=1 Tax=Nocardia abscessus TaxID=120957 RepID=UPI0024547BE9|nr:hypothetical protein [Nocardia abscessus]
MIGLLAVTAVAAWIMTCFFLSTAVLEWRVARDERRDPPQAPRCSCRTVPDFDISAIEPMCDLTEPLGRPLIVREPIPA